jgi:hypothetical protein
MSKFGTSVAALVAATFMLACSSDDSDDGGGGASGGSGGSSGGTSGSGGGTSGSGGGGQMPPAVSFAADIHPILLAKCGASGCHDGSQTPILPGHGAADVMEAYEATQEESIAPGFDGFVYERILIRITDEESMMPPDFANPPCEGEIGTPGCLTQAEVDLIEAWIEAGTPQ